MCKCGSSIVKVFDKADEVTDEEFQKLEDRLKRKEGEKKE